MQTAPTLRVRGLTTTYAGGVRALRGADLTAPVGVYGLLGPNGAGKTTLLRTIATLQLPDAGTVEFAGTDALAQPLAFRRRLGYLPQGFGVYRGQSATRLLDYVARLRGLRDRATRRRRVAETLARVNLAEHAGRAVHTYSGGMLRRFGLATALVASPDLIVVDEPSAGLDPAERIACLELLRELGQHRCVVLSTHLVEDIASVCAQVGVLVRGRMVTEGPTDDLLHGLRGQVWETSFSEAPCPPEALQLSPATTGRTARYWSAAPLVGAVPADPTLADLFALCVAREVQLSPAS